MTDDLIKRLRFFGSPVEREAADRIEELEAACWRMQEERDRAIGWRDSDKDRADKAEAKLLEQVMALPEIAVLVDALKQGLVMGNEICKALPPLNNDPFFNSANAALAAVGVKT